MSENELRAEIQRENRNYEGRIEKGLAGHHRLRYPYLYPFGDEDDDDDEGM